jgi:hypothetical protein
MPVGRACSVEVGIEPTHYQYPENMQHITCCSGRIGAYKITAKVTNNTDFPTEYGLA